MGNAFDLQDALLHFVQQCVGFINAEIAASTKIDHGKFVFAVREVNEAAAVLTVSPEGGNQYRNGAQHGHEGVAGGETEYTGIEPGNGF